MCRGTGGAPGGWLPAAPLHVGTVARGLWLRDGAKCHTTWRVGQPGLLHLWEGQQASRECGNFTGRWPVTGRGCERRTEGQLGHVIWRKTSPTPDSEAPAPTLFFLSSGLCQRCQDWDDSQRPLVRGARETKRVPPFSAVIFSGTRLEQVVSENMGLFLSLAWSRERRASLSALRAGWMALALGADRGINASYQEAPGVRLPRPCQHGYWFF